MKSFILGFIFGFIISLIVAIMKNSSIRNDFYNKFFKYFPKFIRMKYYKNSGIVDILGNPILEGSIISGWWHNHIFGGLPNEANNVHCVEYDEDYGKEKYFSDEKFGSDVHHDWEPLSYYKEIIVLGHVEDYRKQWTKQQKSNKEYEDYIDKRAYISGNFGSVIKY